jgi:hypothetical protein
MVVYRMKDVCGHLFTIRGSTIALDMKYQRRSSEESINRKLIKVNRTGTPSIENYLTCMRERKWVKIEMTYRSKRSGSTARDWAKFEIRGT